MCGGGGISGPLPQSHRHLFLEPSRTTAKKLGILLLYQHSPSEKQKLGKDKIDLL